ncbi:MAG: GGDEF domain-containing protein [Pseudomonadota bacterium]
MATGGEQGKATEPARRETDRERLADAAIVVAPIEISERLSCVFERFADPAHPTVVPIIDADQRPLGVIRERDLRSLLHSPFGLDLARNKNAIIRIQDVFCAHPVSDIDSDPDAVAAAIAADPKARGALLTRDGCYAGFITSEGVLRLCAEKRLMLAEDANPLTRLPGNRAVDAFLGCVAETDACPRALCYFDFNHFKPFNDAYGFRIGDRAIQLFSDILKSEFDARKWRVCHIGGDDFFAGSLDAGREQAVERATSAIDRFRHQAESLYPLEDRRAGRVRLVGRDGEPREYPLLSCAVGVVAIPAGAPIRSPEALVALVSDAKKRAKASPDDLAILDVPSSDAAIARSA